MDWGMFLSNLVGNQTRGKTLYDQEQARLQALAQNALSDARDAEDRAYVLSERERKKAVDELAATNAAEDRNYLLYQRGRQIGEDSRTDVAQAEEDAFDNQLVGDIDEGADPLFRPMTVKRATQLGYKYVPKADREAAKQEAELADVKKQISFWEGIIKDPAVLARAPGYVKAVQRYASLTRTEAPIETVGRIPEIGAYQQVAGTAKPGPTSKRAGDLFPNILPQFADSAVPVDPASGLPAAKDVSSTWFPKPAEPEKPLTTDQVTARILQKLANGETLSESEDRALKAWSGTRYPQPAEDQRTSDLRKELTDLWGNVDAAIKSGNAGLAAQAVEAYNARLGEVQKYVPTAASGFQSLDAKSIVRYIPNEAEATAALASQRAGGAADRSGWTRKDAETAALANFKAEVDQYNKTYKDAIGRIVKGAPPPPNKEESIRTWYERNAPQFLPGTTAQTPSPAPSPSPRVSEPPAPSPAPAPKAVDLEAMKKDPTKAVDWMVANTPNAQGKMGSLTGAKDKFKANKDKLRAAGWPVDTMEIVLRRRMEQYNQKASSKIKW